MNLKKFSEKYLDELISMHKAFKKHFNHKYSEKEVNRTINGNKKEILLIFDDNTLVGYAIWQLNYHNKKIFRFLDFKEKYCSLLDSLYIKPEFRGRGYAKEFFRIFEPYINKKGAKIFVFGTAAKNVTAVQAYKKMGFISKQGYFDEDGDNCVYVKELR